MLAVRFPRKYFPLAAVPLFGAVFNWLRPTEWGARFLSGEHVAWIAAVFASLATGMLYADLLKYQFGFAPVVALPHAVVRCG